MPFLGGNMKKLFLFILILIISTVSIAVYAREYKIFYNSDIVAVNGTSATTYSPDALLNREQALLIAVRMVENLE